MAIADNNTVQLKISLSSPYIEGKVEIVSPSQNMYPGHMVVHSATTVDSWKLADFPAITKFIVVENIYQGKTVDTIYEPGDKLYIRALRGGDIVWAWLAADRTVTIGHPLMISDATGSWGCANPATPGVTATDAGFVYATAMEAKSTAGGGPARLKIIIR